MNPFCPDTGRKEIINLNYYFALLCGASKTFYEDLKKPS